MTELFVVGERVRLIDNRNQTGTVQSTMRNWVYVEWDGAINHAHAVPSESIELIRNGVELFLEIV